MATQQPQSYEETVTDIENTFGILPGYLGALPEQDLVNEWPNLKRFLFGETELDPKIRELVGLAVAAAIGCEFCRHFHRGAAQLHGATDEELAELSFLASYTPRYSALIQAQDYDIETFRDETAQIADHLRTQAAQADD
ncbi:carboxymuconolactone decarboxylase family protein [Natrononativus amylolyticus]|uniref:carboxymuconolactone decarboxylase family protein n=1 Tax=Natrononativus amylolyticus TaxID=2963434 RepID=UPI0020CE1729|nr:carboxymuconolactone decarboxylase family protein [Natrononativus amylolyticus]